MLAPKELGEKLKAARTASGRTQENIAKCLEVTKATIHKYEKGIITFIPLKVRVWYNIFLHVPEEDLFSVEELTEEVEMLKQMQEDDENCIFLDKRDFTQEHLEILEHIIPLLMKPECRVHPSQAPDQYALPQTENELRRGRIEIERLEKIIKNMSKSARVAPDPEDQPPKEE